MGTIMGTYRCNVEVPACQLCSRRRGLDGRGGSTALEQRGFKRKREEGWAQEISNVYVEKRFYI